MIKESSGVYIPQFRDKVNFLQSDIKNFIKNLKYKKRLFSSLRAEQRDIFFMIFDPELKHPGLADRLKAVVSTYNIAKKNHYRFKLYFETPFRLSDYLAPQFDWEASLDDLEFSLLDTKLFNECNWHDQSRLIPHKQYQCYQYAGNVMPRVFENTGSKWSDLFHELFCPSDRLKAAYGQLNIRPKSYVSCHLRFVNALEKFEDTFFNNHLNTETEREALIKRCKEGIREVQKANPGLDVYVFSDSKSFLDNADGMKGVKVLEHSHVGHICNQDAPASHMKTFLDLYVMSQGRAVYRFSAPELYSISHYALLAATIGNLPFYDVMI